MYKKYHSQCFFPSTGGDVLSHNECVFSEMRFILF